MLNERERLDAAIDSVVGIVMFDRTGTIVASNEVFRRVTGYTRQEIESGLLSWRTLTPPEWVEESERQIQKLRSTGRIGPYVKEYCLKNGSRRWLLFDGRRIDEDLIIECCVDITERRQAELAAKRSEERQRQAVAELAHELNNPLQIAVAAIGVLRAEAKDGPAMDALAGAIERLSDLSHRLMETVDAEAEEKLPERKR